MPQLISKTRITFLAASFLLLLNFGCSKDIMAPTNELPFDDKIVGFENTSGPMDVALAKRYYERLKVEKGEFVKAVIPNNPNPNYVPNLKNKRYPFFNQAYVSETKHSTAVEIPIRFDTRTSRISVGRDKASLNMEDTKTILKHSFDRFIVYKSKKTGEIRHRMITYLPALDYLKKRNFNVKHNQLGKLDKEFSGNIVYKRWDGTTVYTLTFTNGKRTRYSVLKNNVSTRTGE